MDYRVELDGKIWKNGSKTQILEKKIQGTVSVQEMLCFLVSTICRILTITCSFLIRFE